MGARSGRRGTRSHAAVATGLVALSVLAGSAAAGAAQQQPDSIVSGNPIVRHMYTADPAALVHEGRLYVFTGRDEASPTFANFQMREWRVFSADTASTNPANWQDHGPLLSLENFAWADANAWAAEVVQGPDGRFYWYVSVRWRDAEQGKDRMSIGVAVADHPLGPYRDAIGRPLITSSMPNASAHNIDPSVLVDPDHGIFLYWGSFWAPRYVKLKDSMTELDSELITPEGLPGFWEAPWIFKRNGIYYNAYASNRNIDDDGCVTSDRYACIRYSTAEHPAGPWTHRGIVLEQVSSTTNHPALVEFPAGSDQWWMIYHTADLPEGGTFRRSVAIDRLFFNDDGTMRTVVQTRYNPPARPPQPGRNAARTATVTCSFTSAWEDCAALNSGREPDSSSMPGPNIGTRWGTWPEAGSHWVQYEWELPVRLEAAEFYWFQDAADEQEGGVKRPGEWSLEYWTGEDWAAVAGASGFGTELDRFNRATFPPVTTTGMRATLATRHGAAGVGALQWKVIAAQPAAVEPVHVTTRRGSPPELPAAVTLRFADDVRLQARVWWEDYDRTKLAQPGSFTVTGIVENTEVPAAAIVTVEPSTAGTTSGGVPVP